ncbi:BnaC03g33950D [Brassica napus]|uniref:BnaC03g33950D protein n=1 Tax=Brassica napus TaxID=3708 RepID=A0A078HTN1_BRANA|nr:BnaC03g33950D [Brassica napus]
MENTGKSSISTDRKTCEKTVDSSSSAKPNGKSTASSVTVDSSASVKSNEKSTASSAILKKPNKKAAVSSANPMYPTAATALSSAHGDQVMLFRDVSHGPREAELIVWNFYNFFGSRSKDQYRVTVSFTWNSSLSVLENPPVLIPEDKFRFHSYEEFKANCDSKGDLYAETFAITSSSSRVFMDADVQPTKDYLEWLSSNSDIANRIAAEVVTKHETVTLEELFSYIKQEASKGSAWYYISCDGCNNKAVKGPTSLICNNKKCGKSEVTGVPQYLTRISVYDKSEQAVFVILGDAGKELTGKHAAELVAKYFEANDGVGAEHCVPVPQALLDTIGQTRKFVVKVSDHNLKGKTQSITVTKILPLEAPLPSAVGEESGSSGGLGDTAGDRARKAAEILESDAAKRSKSG